MSQQHLALRQGRIALTLILCCYLSPRLMAQSVREGSPPEQWRVIWQRDPATTAILAWNTRTPGQRHVLRIRPRQSRDPSPFQQLTAVSGTFSYRRPDDPPLYYHHVALTELQPATAYEVQFESDGQSSPTFYFVTAPADESPFSLLFGGDSRTGVESRRAVNKLMAQLVLAGAASADPADHILALMHAGDYVNRGMDLDQWSTWMSDHELTVTTDGRLLPIIPARGNHDRGRLYCEAFGFDVLDNHNWFAMDFGRQLRLITLNTEASIAGEQAKWLVSELQGARDNHNWLVAQYHRPAYAAVKWPSGALLHWVPIFEQFHVDLVCEGDGHNIKRTMPIRNSKPDPTGVVYIGEGGLGVPQRNPKTWRWYLQPPGVSDRGHHVHRLKFESDVLTGECILLSGEIRDTWQQSRRNPDFTVSRQP